MFARLASQVIGTWLGYVYVLTRTPHNVEAGLYMIWRRFLSDEWSVYSIFVAHALVSILHAVFTLRQAQTRPEMRHPPGRAWDLVRSGLWVTFLYFPWGGPACSFIVYLWLQNSYGFSSMSMLAVSFVGPMVQGIVADLLCEESYHFFPDKTIVVADDGEK